MSKVRISRTSGQGVFNTLEQSGTIIQGKGAEIGVNNKMKQWSKRKTITQRMMGPCIDIATKKGAVKRVKQYWQTYWCFNRAVSVDGYLHGKYCKNRFCTLCQSIRKAVIINKYVPVLLARIIKIKRFYTTFFCFYF